MKDIPHSHRADPTYPVGHPEYKWTSGADVQATWMRLTNWRPIHTNQPPKYVEPGTGFIGEGIVSMLANRRRAG